MVYYRRFRSFGISVWGYYLVNQPNEVTQMRVELTVNGNLLQGKLTMSNTQRHEWETAKDPSRRVRAWVRRYVAEMGYSAPADDSAIDVACKAADGVITITALPITGNGNGKPQSTRKATASKASRKPSRKASGHAQGVLGRDTEEGGEMAGVWEFAPEQAAIAEEVRHERQVRREYAAMLGKASELERKVAIYQRLAAAASASATVYSIRHADILSSNRKARKCGRVAAKGYAVEMERKRERDIALAALIAEQTAAIAAKDSARLADISARIAAIVAA